MTTLARRLWAAPLRGHALAYALLLVVLLPVAGADATPWTPDEGSYALQVRALQDGDWAFPYEAARYDPEGRFFPVVNSQEGEHGWYVYPQHPAYVLALHGAVSVLGERAGLLVLPVLGALAAAVVAWLLAGEFDRRASRPAFWLVALGPVLVASTVVWAHAPSAAISGLAALGAAWLVKRERLPWAVLLTFAALGVGVLVRAEGVLFGIALGAALAGGGVLGRRWSLVATGAGAIAVTATIAFAERAWVSSIVGTAPAVLRTRDGAIAVGTGGGGGGVSIGDYLSGRLEGAWNVLLAGSYNRFEVGLLALVGALLLAYAGMLWRRGRPGWPREVAALAVVAVVLYVARFAMAPRQPITGVLAAWPVVVLIAMGVQWRGVGWPTRVLAGTVFLFVGAVLATQYREAGGFEWGGRFLTPAVVPVAAVLAGALQRLRDRGAFDRLAGAAVVLVALVPTLLGVVSVGMHRAEYRAIVDELDAVDQGVVVTHEQVLPRFGWRLVDRRPWMLVPAPELVDVIERLRRGGVRAVTAVVPFTVADEVAAAYPRAEDATGDEVARFGWRIVVLEQ